MSDKTYRLGAYILICLLAIVGFFQLQNANSRIENASEQAAYALCQSINENRSVIRDLISQTQPISVPSGADASLRSVIEDSNARNQEFRHTALVRLPVKDCPPSPFKNK